MSSSENTLMSDSVNMKQQPKGLYVLFFTEMWERFGFYCVQVLLVLYLTKVFLFSDSTAYGLFAAFAAFLYATPVLGGYLADRYIGYVRGVVIGGFLLAIGYFTLAAASHGYLFYLALSLLICGNGFFKSNVSSLLGTLYDGYHDPRRDSGFTLFYMGINLGSFSGTVLCSYIAIQFGWHYAFLTAGIGMILGMAVFFLGRNKIARKDTPSFPKAHYGMVSPTTIILFFTLLAVYALSFLIQHSQEVTTGLMVFGLLVLLAVFFMTFQYEKTQRNKLIVLVTLMAFSIVFWALYEQLFLSITLFIDRAMDRHVLGYLIPTAMFHSFSPLLIIMLSPLLASLWFHLQRKGLNISIPLKFAIGLFLMGFGFLMLTAGVYSVGPNVLMPMHWLILCYFFQVVGELSLSPIGLSAVTKLSPPRLVGMFMGVWFLSYTVANAVAGWLARFASISSEQALNGVALNIAYANTFAKFGALGMGIGLILFLLNPYLRRMMGH